MEQDTACQSPEKEKESRTGEAKEQTVPEGLQDGPGNGVMVTIVIGLCNNREEQNRNGIGDGRRKQDQWKAHSGEHSVDPEGIGIAESKQHQPVWDIDGFYALEQIENDTVGGKRNGKRKQLSGNFKVLRHRGCRMRAKLLSLNKGGNGLSLKNMVSPCKDRDQRYDHRSTFPDDKTHYGKADRWLHPLLATEKIDQIDGADTADLFSKLGNGRDSSLAYSIKIAVNAGMNGCHGDRKGNNTEQGCCSFF